MTGVRIKRIPLLLLAPPRLRRLSNADALAARAGALPGLGSALAPAPGSVAPAEFERPFRAPRPAGLRASSHLKWMPRGRCPGSPQGAAAEPIGRVSGVDGGPQWQPWAHWAQGRGGAGTPRAGGPGSGRPLPPFVKPERLEGEVPVPRSPHRHD